MKSHRGTSTATNRPLADDYSLVATSTDATLSQVPTNEHRESPVQERHGDDKADHRVVVVHDGSETPEAYHDTAASVPCCHHQDNQDNNSDERDSLFLPNDDELSIMADPSSGSWLQRLLFSTWTSDTRINLANIAIVDGPYVIKFFKFLLFTIFGIVLYFYFVRWPWLDWEHDTRLHLYDMFVYESQSILLDIIVFFTIGRMWQGTQTSIASGAGNNHRMPTRRGTTTDCLGIDHGAWIAVASLAIFYPSFISTLSFLQHSVTLYEIHCLWPWQLYLYILLMIPAIGYIIFQHVVYAFQRKVVMVKLLEMATTVLLFLVPPLQSNFFHFHHWFAAWLVGMHCNYHGNWWSTYVQAWCWGCYINGIAVWGRDPVLTCGYAFYMSAEQSCPYLACYIEETSHPQNHTNPHKPMLPPDWRNCSADTYHG